MPSGPRKVRFPVGTQRIPGGSRGASSYRGTVDVREQVADMEKAFVALIESIPEATAAGVYTAMQEIYDRSQELVPVDTGALKESGFIDVRDNARGVNAVVGYAPGSHPPYAAIVHERLDLHHEPPTQAKFLEQAVNEKIAGFRNTVLEAMRAYIS